MPRTVQELIQRHGINRLHQATGIGSTILSRYGRGEKPNYYSVLLLHKASLQLNDPLPEPQEDLYSVKLAAWLIRHNKSPLTFAQEIELPYGTFLDLLNGKVPDIDRVTQRSKSLVYEGTLKEGDPLEIFKPSDYKATQPVMTTIPLYLRIQKIMQENNLSQRQLEREYGIPRKGILKKILTGELADVSEIGMYCTVSNFFSC